jgi:VanZ family protein
VTVTFDRAPAQNRRLAFASQVLPAIAYTLALFYGGLIRLGALPEVGFVPTDKLLHALAFGGLAALLARAMHWLRPTTTLRSKLFLAALGSSCLGLLLEICQAFTVYRSADPWDWVADTVGATLAAAALLVIAPRLRPANG